METTEETKVTEPETPSQETNSSAEVTWDAAKYPSWQKSIGKEYWGNPKLKDFDSMKSVIESIVNPKANAPEKYDLGLSEDVGKDVEEALRKADISQENAKAISDAFGKHLAKSYSLDSIKDIYGADFEEADSNVSKAIEKVCGSDEKLKKSLTSELRNNPSFFAFASVVGKNLGSEANLDTPNTNVKHEESGDPFMDIIFGRK